MDSFGNPIGSYKSQFNTRRWIFERPHEILDCLSFPPADMIEIRQGMDLGRNKLWIRVSASVKPILL